MECEEATGETLNCGTGKEVPINELARMMISISGRSLGIEHRDAKAQLRGREEG